MEYWRTGLSDLDIISQIQMYNPDVIAISCCTVVDRADTKYLCELIIKNIPNIPVILGGHEISHNYEDILIERIPRNYIPGIAGICIGLGQPYIGKILE